MSIRVSTSTSATCSPAPTGLTSQVAACDVVLPLVAIATPATYVRDPLRVFELDFEANLPIVRMCVKHKKRLIFPSTSEVYGVCKGQGV